MADDSTGAGADQGIPVGPAPLSPDQMNRLRGILGRSPYYVDDNSFLRLQVTCSLAGVVVTLNWRKSTLDASNPIGTVSMAPRSDGSFTFVDTPIGEGLLYNVTAFASAGAPAIGQCFVQVLLMSGNNANPTMLATLVAAYVTGIQSLGWPGTPVQSSLAGPGFMRTTVLAAPGAGNQINVQVPLNFRWRFLTLTTNYVADAAVGGRVIILTSTGGGGTRFFAPNPLICPPSGVVNLVWADGFSTEPIVTGAIGLGPLPRGLLFGPLGALTTIVFGLDPGDQFGTQTVFVEEHLTVQA